MTFDEQIAARTIFGEARGESEVGQRAVAHVVANRLKSGKWGDKLASVCLARKQFSCWNDKDMNRVAMANVPDDAPEIVKFAGFIRDALAGQPDPTSGALHYYAASILAPAWAVGKPITRIGRHVFVCDVP